MTPDRAREVAEEITKKFIHVYTYPESGESSQYLSGDPDQLYLYIEQALLQFAREYHREKSKGLVEALQDIKTWGPCYCLTEEESSTAGGKICNFCLASEALAEHEELMEEK